jgi:glutaredoxin
MNTLRYALMSALIPCFVHATDIHQWRDKDGEIYFGDKPPADVETELITVKPNVYESPSIEGLSAIFRQDDKVVMYSASWCGYCKKARSYFAANRVPYTEYDVEKSSKGKRDYRKLGAKGVPVILVGDKRLNGFSEESFKTIYKLK